MRVDRSNDFPGLVVDEGGQGARDWPKHERMRLLAVGAPAAFATFGLFWAMQAAIQVDDFTPPEASSRQLVKIALPEHTDPEEPRVRKPVKPIEAKQPPPAPELTAPSTETTVPVFQASWSSPSTESIRSIRTFVPTPVAISERNAQPIAPPVLAYPRRALERGIEGQCEVSFDVSLKGQPYNIQPLCSDDIFNREAKRAIENVSFMPRIRRGQAVERRNVVYPLEFRIND